MADRIVLHYVPGHSLLHRWDVRCKFLGLLVAGLSLLEIRTSWLLFNSLLLPSLLLLAKLPIRRYWVELRSWFVLLGIFFSIYALTTPGARLSALPWLPLSSSGIYQGALLCWRLALVLGYAVLFTAVTQPKQLRDAVLWLLKPFPFLPRRRIGLMVALTLRLFSLLLDEAEEVRRANKARLGDLRFSPLRRLRSLALPTIRRSFYHVEEISLALAARGYRDDIAGEIPGLPLIHIVPVVLFLVAFIVSRWR